MTTEKSLKIHKKTGKYNFTASEIAEMKAAIPDRINNDIGPKLARIADLQAEIKTLKAHIESLTDTNATDARKIQDGFEQRQQECYRLKNWERRCFQYFSVRDMLLVDTQEFQKDDHQMEFQIVGDLEEIGGDANLYYDRILYWEGKRYGFGEPYTIEEPPRDLNDDLPADATEIPEDGPTAAQFVLNGKEVSKEFFEFAMGANNPFFDSAAEYPCIDGVFVADMFYDDADKDLIAQPISDAISLWINLQPNSSPWLNFEGTHLRRNGLDILDAKANLEKADTIRAKYIKKHGLTSREIEAITNALPF